MELELQEKLEEIYTNLVIEVKYEDIRKYAIYVRIEYKGQEYETKIIYKYDNYLTIDANIANIRTIIDNIILSFYYKKGE